MVVSGYYSLGVKIITSIEGPGSRTGAELKKKTTNKNGADVHKVGKRNSNEQTTKAGRGEIRIEKEIWIMIVWTC